MPPDPFKPPQAIQPPILYKYRGTDLAKLHQILIDNTLWFAEPSTLNDPLEGHHFVRYGNTDTDRVRYFARMLKVTAPHRKPTKRIIEAKRLAREHRGLLPVGDHIAEFNTIRARFGVLSMAARGDIQELWTKYAENHQGVCIGFRTAGALFRWATAVAYVDVLPTLDMILPDPGGKQAEVTKVINSKLSEWAYEEEWRLLKIHVEPARLEEVRTNLETEADREALGEQRGPGAYGFDAADILTVTFGMHSTHDFQAAVIAMLRKARITPVVSICQPAGYNGSFSIVEM